MVVIALPLLLSLFSLLGAPRAVPVGQVLVIPLTLIYIALLFERRKKRRRRTKEEMKRQWQGQITNSTTSTTCSSTSSDGSGNSSDNKSQKKVGRLAFSLLLKSTYLSTIEKA